MVHPREGNDIQIARGIPVADADANLRWLHDIYVRRHPGALA
jgi:hypothetical protein